MKSLENQPDNTDQSDENINNIESKTKINHSVDVDPNISVCLSPELTTIAVGGTYDINSSSTTHPVLLFSDTSIRLLTNEHLIKSFQFAISNVCDGACEQIIADGSVIILENGVIGTTAINKFTYAVSLSGREATIYFYHSSGLSIEKSIAFINNISYQVISKNPTLGVRTIKITRMTDNREHLDNYAADLLDVASNVAVVSSPVEAVLKKEMMLDDGIVDKIESKLVSNTIKSLSMLLQTIHNNKNKQRIGVSYLKSALDYVYKHENYNIHIEVGAEPLFIAKASYSGLAELLSTESTALPYTKSDTSLEKNANQKKRENFSTRVKHLLKDFGIDDDKEV